MKISNRIPIVWPDIAGYAGFDAAQAEWQSIVIDYETHPSNLQLAWLYLGHHPMFWDITVGDENHPAVDFSSAWGRRRCLEVGIGQDVGGICVFLDVDPILWDPDSEECETSHFQGPTHEQVYIAAAAKIHDVYGNDREFMTVRWFG